MNHFQTILSDIFDRGAEHRLSQDEERETIHAAKAGDEAATVALLYAYAPALRNALARFRLSDDQNGDARSAAALGLLEAVRLFDPETDDRLAARISFCLMDALSDLISQSADMDIPQKTRSRYFGILRRAGGDVHKGALLAPQYAMCRETFYAVHDAVRVNNLDDTAESADGEHFSTAATPLWNPEDVYADAEDRILVEMALAAVDDLEADICRMSYGFTSYNPVPDGQIAAELGMTRPTVQRRRAGALSKMRDALGA